VSEINVALVGEMENKLLNVLTFNHNCTAKNFLKCAYLFRHKPAHNTETVEIDKKINLKIKTDTLDKKKHSKHSKGNERGLKMVSRRVEKIIIFF